VFVIPNSGRQLIPKLVLPALRRWRTTNVTVMPSSPPTVKIGGDDPVVASQYGIKAPGETRLWKAMERCNRSPITRFQKMPTDAVGEDSMVSDLVLQRRVMIPSPH
jgi:hypothetical protein